ncbi:MAG: peptidoglycan-binding protein [Alphaproteobacteria bacterium]
MTTTTIRIGALAAALMFGTATTLPLTANAQTAAAPAAPAATTPPAGTAMPKTHRMHHRYHHAAGSAKVKAVQDALNKEGASLAVDGHFGPKTRAAIKSFQQAHGLKASGHLDKATRAALKV